MVSCVRQSLVYVPAMQRKIKLFHVVSKILPAQIRGKTKLAFVVTFSSFIFCFTFSGRSCNYERDWNFVRVHFGPYHGYCPLQFWPLRAWHDLISCSPLTHKACVLISKDCSFFRQDCFPLFSDPFFCWFIALLALWLLVLLFWVLSLSGWQVETSNQWEFFPCARGFSRNR